MSRIVSWFSCGATSAVATHLTLEKYKGKKIEIIYTDTGSEHPDNHRFLKDCEKWFGQEIKILKSDKYKDIWDVFEKTRYLVGVGGARCTTELKKKLRFQYQKPDDLQIFGFDKSEQKRFDRFKKNNFDVNIEAPLIERGISKSECLGFLENQGIEIPFMYKLGYKNANCVPCVKGQQGYWNKIRKDFPDVFDRMAKVERKLNVAINKSYAGDGTRKRVFLDELNQNAGRYDEEISIECGVLCDMQE